MAKLRQFSFNLYQEHTYIATNSSDDCVIVDPAFGNEAEKAQFDDFLKGTGLRPAAILLTHAHMDHILGVQALIDEYGLPVYMNGADRTVLDAQGVDFPFTPTLEGQKLEIAGFVFEVIDTPGHTPGSVCYLDREAGLMFTGDTLFAGTIGRTDFPYSSYDDEIRSIMEKLIWLDPSTEIWPGHGPSSTIGTERTGNPFLEPFNEREEMDF